MSAKRRGLSSGGEEATALAREIERKFLVRNDDWRKQIDGPGAAIRQAYVFVGDDRSCRVRIVDETTARLTIKTGRGIDRGEFEYEIPLQDAEDLAAERFGEQNQIVVQCRERLDECRRLSA